MDISKVRVPPDFPKATYVICRSFRPSELSHGMLSVEKDIVSWVGLYSYLALPGYVVREVELVKPHVTYYSQRLP